MNKQELIAHIKNYLNSVDNGSTMSVPTEIFPTMARIALAALTAEPVMYCMKGSCLDEQSISDCEAVVDAWVDEWNNHRMPGEPTYKTVPLYTAPPAPVAPAGWKLVPVEPTQAMINAWLSEVADWRGHVAGYRSMLAAAPEFNNVQEKDNEKLSITK